MPLALSPSDDSGPLATRLELQRFTTRYSASEDRICIEGLSVQDEVVHLWLTCRMLRQLLPPLLGLITPAAETLELVTVMARWALAKARSQHQAVSAVVPSVQKQPAIDPPLPTCWLVRSIDVKSSAQQALVTFNVVDSQAIATIAFTPARLRQWLGIVHRLWQRAGWPEHAWPGWMQEEVGPMNNVVH